MPLQSHGGSLNDFSMTSESTGQKCSCSSIVHIVVDWSAYVGATDAVVCQHHALGGEGAVGLANAIVRATQSPPDFKFLYELDLPIKVNACEA